MNKFFIAFLLFFISAIGISQESQNKARKINFRKQLDSLTVVQINQLKEGVLLVRLKTKINSISALRKVGKAEMADKLQKKQTDYNLKIIAAFRTNFHFCPTYFFLSDYSQNVIDKQFDKVVFLNDSLHGDSTIRFDNKKFLCAEFGTIEQDTTKYFSYSTLEHDGNQNLKKTNNYYGGSNMGFGALIIRSDKLVQLRRPFPFYVRTFDSLPFERSLPNAVRRMDSKLFKFYMRKRKTQ